MFVYLITNRINGKQYVGQHSGDSLESYWKHCLGHAISKSHDKPCLYNAVRKYGSENFIIRPLVIVETKWEMDLYERGLIKSLNTRRPNGYNLTEGGDGVLGLRHSEESIEKNRTAHLGRHHSEETKKKMSASQLGRTHTEETKRRMSEYVKTEEHCKKISLAKMGNKSRLGMKNSEETKRKMSLAAKNRRIREATNGPTQQASIS